MKMREGLAYEMREVDVGSIFEIPDTSKTPRMWAIKTSAMRSHDNAMGCTIIGTTDRGPSGEFAPGVTLWIQQNSYVLHVDIDIYAENKCVYRTFQAEQ